MSEKILPPEPLACVQAVAAGERHFVALLDDGSLRAWDRYNWIPDIPTEPLGIVEIAAAGSHIVARSKDGKVFVWGAAPELRPSIPEDVQVSAIFTSQDYIAVLAEEPFPVIDTPLKNHTVQAGQTAIFSGHNGNRRSVMYEWIKDGELIPGANESHLQISDSQPEDAGHYTVILRDSDGAHASSTATLSVVDAPILSGTRGRLRAQLPTTNHILNLRLGKWAKFLLSMVDVDILN